MSLWKKNIKKLAARQNDKVPYDLEEMQKDLYIQKRKLAELYASQRTTVRKMYHMLPYEYWKKEEYTKLK